jgi:hypothetical protein
MARIVSSLEARDGGDALRQEVYDLAFALIAPLRADDDDELAHGLTLANQKKKDHADEHAAESRNAQLAVGRIQEPGKRALHATGGEERRYSFENKD